MDALDIVELTKSNDGFRREVVTAEHSQVVLMTIRPGEEISVHHTKAEAEAAEHAH